MMSAALRVFVAASVVVSIFPYKNPTASREDVLEAITVLDALGKRLVRILGIKHPKTFNVQAAAYQARQKLAAMEPPRRATLEDALAAEDTSDATDPANSGCGDFGWTQMTPAP